MKLVLDNKPTNSFATKVSKLVDDAKRNTQWRKQFMDWEIEKAYSFDAGKEVGLQEKAIEIAKTMLSDELSPDKVSLYSGLPLEQVLELQKQSPVKA